MIQYHFDLLQQIKNIKEKTLSQGQIQKIYSTSYYISFSVRIPGKTWHLYFGRGSGYEGIWSHDSPPPAILRRKDYFLEYLRKHLTSCSFLDFSLDPFDRILKMDYQKFGQLQSLFWYWRGRKLYLMHYYRDYPDSPSKVFLSWKGKSFIQDRDQNDFFSYFDEVGRKKENKKPFFSTNLVDVNTLLDQELSVHKLKSEKIKPSFLQRKKLNISEDLKRVSEWRMLQVFIETQKSLDHLDELKIGSHKIKFNVNMNTFARRDKIFEKIKKLKKGELILLERLSSIETEISGKNQKKNQPILIPIIRPIWGEDKTKVSATKQVLHDYKIINFNGFKAGVGLSAQGNDALRNKWARKEDLWIHLEGKESAHVILKIDDHISFTPEMLNIGASLVAYFSRFKSDWIPIIFTQVKNLKGVSGDPGMVIFKKEKHLNCPMQKIDAIF
jgi:predicted ribosome quality control (RQC) complex YloA/Tae2 family protein